MPPETPISEEDQRFETLYRAEYAGLLRYAEVTLKNHGSLYSSVSDRAEEAVQEMFAFAWENREKLLSRESPTGWLYRSLYFKVMELLREDRVWTKHVLQMSEPDGDETNGDFSLKLELDGIIPTEDYLLLKRLYLDGYTYKELCEKLGLKKSALAMRIKRIKEHFLKEYDSE